MSTTGQITTADELLAAGDIGRCELIRGTLMMMSPAGGRHGRITHNIALAIGRFVADHRLGVMFTAETGFILERAPDTVRAPDIAFITADRAAEADVPGYVPIAPDLVVEVLSPDDRALRSEASGSKTADVLDKVRQWLAAGVALVWGVDPRTRTVTAHHPDGRAELLDADRQLKAPDLLPGFTHLIGAIFE